MRLILRIIGIPFMMVFFLYQAIRLYVTWVLHWTRYGGEMMVYNEKYSHGYFLKILDKIEKL